MRATASTARVFLNGETMRLARKRSSFGERFGSEGTTLIVDGDFAIFARADRALRCFETGVLAERG